MVAWWIVWEAAKCDSTSASLRKRSQQPTPALLDNQVLVPGMVPLTIARRDGKISDLFR